MTLQASGPISLANVRTELGGSGTISLNDAAVRTLAGLPTGTIGLANLYGKTAAAPVSNFSGSALIDAIAASASIRVRFRGDGNVSTTFAPTGYGGGNIGTNWYNPLTTDIGNSYYIRATLQSGSAFSGLSSGVWTQIGPSFQDITLSRSTYGNSVCQVLVEISNSPGGTILASGTFTLDVTAEA